VDDAAWVFLPLLVLWIVFCITVWSVMQKRHSRRDSAPVAILSAGLGGAESSPAGEALAPPRAPSARTPTVIDHFLAHSTLRRLAQRLLAFPNEASYVSDRLHSVMRMSEESRPSISVRGTPLSRHALLGSSIKIGADGPVQALSPVGLVTAIRAVTRRAIVASKTGSPPVAAGTAALSASNQPFSGE
jgi:hypothetical protein